MNRTVAGLFTIGSALYEAPKPPIPQPTPSQPFPPPPWPGPRCKHCKLPRSQYEGHWCLAETGETWRKWSQS